MRIAVREKVIGISRALETGNVGDISLYEGITGISIFFYQLFRLTSEPVHLDKCRSLLDRVIGLFDSVQLDHTMGRGYTGIACGFDQLIKEQAIELDPDQFFRDIDAPIYINSLRSLMNKNYNFSTGAPAAVLHALHRLPDKKASGYIRQFVDALSGFDLVAEFEYRLGFDSGLSVVAEVADMARILFKVYGHADYRTKVLPLIEDCLSWLASRCSGNTGEALEIILAFSDASEYLGKGRWDPMDPRLVNGFLAYSRSVSAAADGGFLIGLPGLAYRYRRLCRKYPILDGSMYPIWIAAMLNFDPFREGPGLNHGAAGLGLVLIDYLNGGSGQWDMCMFSAPGIR